MSSKFSNVASALCHAVTQHPAFVDGTLSWSLHRDNDWAVVHVLYEETADYDGGWSWELWDCRGATPEYVEAADSKQECLDMIDGLLENEDHGIAWSPEVN